MDRFTSHSDSSPVLTEISRFEEPAATLHPYHVRGALGPLKIPTLNLVLFLLTLLTTTMAGSNMAGMPVLLSVPATWANLVAGLSFSIPLMLILFAHEMGHYLTSRRYGVEATLPYFIPAPLPSVFFIGTFGAFIRMKSPPRSRRAMFDIGAAGPWAGFIVALMCLVIGLKRSQVAPLDTSQGGLQLGNAIFFWTISRVMLGVNPDTVNVILDPIAFAGWLGLLVTTLNLLPVGQLDGGHVVYSLFGARWHRRISRLFTLGCLLMVVIPMGLNSYLPGLVMRLFHTSQLEFWPGWLFWFMLVLILGLGHPSTMDNVTPLTGMRRLAAWGTIALFIGTFSPVPASFAPPAAEPAQPGQMREVGVPANRAIPSAAKLRL